MEVHDIVQEAVIKTIPKKKKCKKAKWLSEEALWIAEKKREVKGKGEKDQNINDCILKETLKRKEVKGKGEKERYYQLNA